MTGVQTCALPIYVYYNEHQNKFKIAGVSQLDYLALYKLYTYTQQSSYRLDFIGQLEVGIGKIEYEGSLQNLYETDINKYVEYNLNDVVIVKELDDKLKFIELACGVSHLGHIGYEDIFFSSRYLEGAMLVYMKDIGVVAPNKPPRTEMGSSRPSSWLAPQTSLDCTGSSRLLEAINCWPQ